MKLVSLNCHTWAQCGKSKVDMEKWDGFLYKYLFTKDHLVVGVQWACEDVAVQYNYLEDGRDRGRADDCV